MLRQIQKKIDDLNEDSDWSDSDEENSPYIMADKYQKKAVKIHKKIQELLKEKGAKNDVSVRFFCMAIFISLESLGM